MYFLLTRRISSFYFEGGVKVNPSNQKHTNPGRKYHPFRTVVAITWEELPYNSVRAFPLTNALLLNLLGNLEKERRDYGKRYKLSHSWVSLHSSGETVMCGQSLSITSITIISRSIFRVFLGFPSIKGSVHPNGNIFSLLALVPCRYFGLCVLKYWDDTHLWDFCPHSNTMQENRLSFVLLKELKNVTLLLERLSTFEISILGTISSRRKEFQ